MSLELNIFQKLKVHWFSVTLFFIPLFIYFFGNLYFYLPEILQHIMLTLSAVMGIHLLDRLYLVNDTEKTLNDLVSHIRNDINDQTQSLIHTSKSLESMDQSGIARIYPSRSEAAVDIKTDIISQENSKIRLMGVSLNDFVQGMDNNLLEAWNILQDYVKGKKSLKDRKDGLDIRFMIIDPNCFGAVLRSEAESEKASALSQRLKKDVDAAAKDLFALEQAVNSKETGVKFECKLYRLPPIMFLSWTDFVCYVQQYHFWSKRDNKTPTPVLKFRNLPASSSTTYPYHSEMEHHFDWIWENAAISVNEYLNGADVGPVRGNNMCGARNIYIDPNVGANRIIYLLGKAEKKVSIQGISLNSFFKQGRLREAISSVLENNKVEIEVLLLDPNSKQAEYRSYREHLIIAPGLSFDNYLKSGEHERSDLYHDTRRTIENIKHMVDDISRRNGKNWQPKLTVKLYKSSPACFILIIDDNVLVEQYHYGKIAKHTRAILGKDMPLIEYYRMPHKLYKKQSDPLRRPFDLLVNHYDFVLSQSQPMEEWLAAQC